MNDKELFVKIANIFNLPYKEEENGDITAEISDNLWFYAEYKKILKKRIENKMALVIKYRIEVAPMKGEERLLMLEELFRYEQELLDLEIEYISKDDYVKNYQGHIAENRISYQKEIGEAKQKLPELLLDVKKYLNEQSDLFAHKINAQLYGLTMRGDSAVESGSEAEISNSYKDLKIIFYHATKKS